MAESYLRDHFPRHPIMPNTLIVEGMGQTGMYLACEATGYSDLILLAKVSSARFHREAVPGDLLTYSVSLDSIGQQGVSVSASSRIGDLPQGEAELLYTRRPARPADIQDMVRRMRLLKVYQIGLAPDGGPLRPPEMITSS